MDKNIYSINIPPQHLNYS